MRKLNIEVLEESGRPGGGHAVIRLMGLHSLPDNVTYRIRPVDTALHADGQGAWIESDRQPLATRITTDGAERGCQVRCPRRVPVAADRASGPPEAAASDHCQITAGSAT